jgi:hypothetical protein
MQLTVTKPFTWAHRGVEVKEYAAGDLDTDAIDQPDVADLIEVATREGWATTDKDEAPKRGRKPSTLKGGPISPAAEAE